MERVSAVGPGKAKKDADHGASPTSAKVNDKEHYRPKTPLNCRVLSLFSHLLSYGHAEGFPPIRKSTILQLLYLYNFVFKWSFIKTGIGRTLISNVVVKDFFIFFFWNTVLISLHRVKHMYALTHMKANIIYWFGYPWQNGTTYFKTRRVTKSFFWLSYIATDMSNFRIVLICDISIIFINAFRDYLLWYFKFIWCKTYLKC